MSSTLEGGCLCGALRYRVSAPPIEVGYCHCRMCQRRSGAPAVAYAVVSRDDFAFAQGAPEVYRSSARGERHFCMACGTELLFQHFDDPATVSLNVGTFDEPNALAPERHIWTSSRLRWFETTDDLPRHPEGDTSIEA